MYFPPWYVSSEYIRISVCRICTKINYLFWYVSLFCSDLVLDLIFQSILGLTLVKKLTRSLSVISVGAQGEFLLRWSDQCPFFHKAMVVSSRRREGQPWPLWQVQGDSEILSPHNLLDLPQTRFPASRLLFFPNQRSKFCTKGKAKL